MHQGLRATAVVAIVGVAILAGAAPASAHAALVETTPASGQSADAVAEVTLTFTEPVSIALGGVRLYDQAGHIVDTAGLELDADGTVVRIPTPGLDDGAYVVTWRILSNDEHPVQGAFTFLVGSGGADLTGLADRLLAAQGASVAVGVADVSARLATYVLMVLAAGPFVFAWGCYRRAFEAPAVRSVAWVGWIGLVVASVVAFFVRAPYSSGLAFGDALDADILGELFDARFGRMTLLRALVLLLATPLMAFAMRSGSRGARVALGAIGLGVIVSVSATGHAAVGSQVALAFPADVVHLAAMVTWLGGLLILGTFALRGLSLDDAVTASRRFSRLALVAIGLLVVTGGYQSWRLVRSFDGLVDTDYGRLLVLKLVLVAVIVVAASLSRDVVQKRFVEAAPKPSGDDVSEPLPVGPGAKLADELDERRGGLRTLRRAVTVELVVATLVLGVSAVLVTAEPAVDAQTQVFTEVVEGDRMDFDVLVTPAARGRNDIHVTALDPDGTLTDVRDMQVWLSEPSREIALIEAPLRRLGPGHYFSPGFELPFSGDWQLDIRAFVSESEFVDASTVVDL